MIRRTRDRLFKRCSFILALVLCATGLSLFACKGACAESDKPQPAVQDHVENDGRKIGGNWIGIVDFIGEYNPLGIDLKGSIDYRDSYGFDERYDAVSAYWQSGAAIDINPAYIQPSIDFEWMPWLILTLRLQGDGYYYLGANSGLLSFPSSTYPFGDSVRRARKGTEETGFGRRVLFKPTVQMKVGNILLRNQSDIARYWFPEDKGPYFLELEYDTLLKNNDTLLANRTQALLEIGKPSTGQTLIGPFYEIVYADAARLTRQRVGLLFYSEKGPSSAFFGARHYFAEVGYNLEDTNRAYQEFILIGIGTDFSMK
jgi:hypothetical protein